MKPENSAVGLRCSFEPEKSDSDFWAFVDRCAATIARLCPEPVGRCEWAGPVLAPYMRDGDNGARFLRDLGEGFKGDGWREGWPMSPGQVTTAAVEADFEYLRAWCNDEWFWLCYSTRIQRPDGSWFDGDSCCGFDDQEYMEGEAMSNARASIAADMELQAETLTAANWP